MSYVVCEKSFTAKVQADGTITLDASNVFRFKSATKFGITVVRKTATTGTFGIKAKPPKCDTLLTLTKDDNATIFDLSTTAESQFFGWESPLEELQITPAGVNGTYDLALVGWG